VLGANGRIVKGPAEMGNAWVAILGRRNFAKHVGVRAPASTPGRAAGVALRGLRGRAGVFAQFATRGPPASKPSISLQAVTQKRRKRVRWPFEPPADAGEKMRRQSAFRQQGI